MFLECTNKQETVFPCWLNQETFHWKQMFGHTHLIRKQSLRDHRIWSSLFPQNTNAETLNIILLRKQKVDGKIRNIFVSWERNVLATKVLFMCKPKTFPQTCFINNVSATILSHLWGPFYGKRKTGEHGENPWCKARSTNNLNPLSILRFAWILSIKCCFSIIIQTFFNKLCCQRTGSYFQNLKST